jgi:peptidyl-dipeptidase Dcp
MILPTLHCLAPGKTGHVLLTALVAVVASSDSMLLAADSTSIAGNPFQSASTLPFQYPPFDQIKQEHFALALEAGMTEQLKDVDAIATNPSTPGFDNTVVALQRTGRLLERTQRVFIMMVGAHTNDTLRAIDKEMSPKLAAHTDNIRLNSRLFARIETLYRGRDQLGLDPESKRLLERTYTDFVRSGAKLSEPDKAKLKGMNQEIAALQTAFGQNVQKESNASAIVVEQRSDLAGMSDSDIASAQAAAKNAQKEGKFIIRLSNSSGQPALASLQNRALRERIHKVSVARNRHGGEFDNRPLVARIARLRAERASLLGYANHAAYILEDQTAGTTDRVNKLLADLSAPAVANARREAADLQAAIDQEKGGFRLAPWDWDFYSEKVRRTRFDFDESQLKPYLELNHVLIDGVFYAAGRLYGLSFKERHDLPVYEPTVRVFDVFDADGSPLAIFIQDFYARPSKRGGAWMNSYVNQNALLGTRPVVANHHNITKPPEGEATLLTLDEANTLFHEFGHALHGMFSKVKYPRFGGTQVPRDFSEYPSQVNEMWTTWPEVLKNYAKHYKTGEPMPPALLQKVLAAQKFNQGFTTTEYLAATVVDQALHQLNSGEVPSAEQVDAFESAALKARGLDFPPVPPRYHSSYFLHVFVNSYSAGYYSYIWSEVLDADSVEWLKQHGGLTRENGDHFRRTLLSRGGSEDAMGLFRAFVGREPSVTPLLKRRGLEPPSLGGGSK